MTKRNSIRSPIVFCVWDAKRGNPSPRVPRRRPIEFIDKGPYRMAAKLHTGDRVNEAAVPTEEDRLCH